MDCLEKIGTYCNKCGNIICTCINKINKYRCSCCGDIFEIESSKQWFKSICGNSGDKDCRLIIINNWDDKMELEHKQKQQLIKLFESFINFDMISDERFHNPFSKERKILVSKDAKKLADIALKITKKTTECPQEKN